MKKGKSLSKAEFDSELMGIKRENFDKFSENPTILRIFGHWWLVRPRGELIWDLDSCLPDADFHAWKVAEISIDEDGVWFTAIDRDLLVWNLPYNTKILVPVESDEFDDLFDGPYLNRDAAKLIISRIIHVDNAHHVNREMLGTPLVGLSEPPSDDEVEKLIKILND